jgi:hypothetical protein
MHQAPLRRRLSRGAWLSEGEREGVGLVRAEAKALLRLILVLEQEHRLTAEPAQRATSAFEDKAELLCSNRDFLLLAQNGG